MTTRMVAGIWLIAIVACTAAELSQGRKETIFVGPVAVQESVTVAASARDSGLALKRFADVLQSQLIHALSATRVFQLVERSRKDVLELEQAFADVAVDPDDAALARAGRMTGARFVLLPRVDGFDNRVTMVEHKAIGRASSNRHLFVSATVRVADTTTGELLPDVPSIQITKAESAALAADVQAAAPSDALVVTVGKEAAVALSQRVVLLLRPAKVLTVTGDQVLVNRGSEAGFYQQLSVEFYAAETVVDEDTGEKFLNEVPVGAGIIIRCDPKKSFARIEGENLGIAKGCVVRITGGPVAVPGKSVQADWADGERAIRNSPGPQPAKPVTPGSSAKPW